MDAPSSEITLTFLTVEKLFVTSDAATIIKETDVHHPAAKMIAQAAKMQENEAGDGTNLLISLAGEMMT